MKAAEIHRVRLKQQQRMRSLHKRSVNDLARQERILAYLVKRGIDDEWRVIEAVRETFERPLIAEMDSIFRDQRTFAIEAIRAQRFAGDRLSPETRGLWSLEMIFELSRWLSETWERIFSYISNSLFGGYEFGEAQIGQDLPDFTSFDPAVREIMDTLQEKSESISRTTASSLNELINEAMREGWSIDRTATEIEDRFDEFSRSRSRLIAQQNITASFGRGQLEAFEKAGVDKIWISQRDGVVRDTHRAADGQRKDPADPFVVGAALLRFPGDPETDILQEIMGCRCSMLPVL